MKNNKGMSLLELVAAMAIISLLAGTVAGIIAASTKHYKAAGAEVDVQYEAQAATNQLQDLILNAGAGICYRIGGQMVATDSDYTGTLNDAAQKEICTYRTVEEAGAGGTVQERFTAEKIIWKKSEKKLYYSKYNCEKRADGTYEYQPIEVDCLLAEYVTSFSADFTDAQRKHQVNISVKFVNGEKEFLVEKEIALRNPVKINVTEAELSTR